MSLPQPDPFSTPFRKYGDISLASRRRCWGASRFHSLEYVTEITKRGTKVQKDFSLKTQYSIVYHQNEGAALTRRLRLSRLTVWCHDALLLNLHFHTLLFDGVFFEGPEGALEFRPLPPPTDDEVGVVLARIAARVLRLLRRRGLDPGDADLFQADPVVEESPALAGISSASIQGRIALGPRAGARVWRVGDDPDAPWVLSTAPRHAHLAGFDLHANVAVPAADRPRLEQLCRYLYRPAVAQDRLRRLDDGRIVLTLKTAWADGTRHLVFEPLTLLEKLAALTPRPRINLVLYHGVLAPHAGWHARVVAYVAPPVEVPVAVRASSHRT